LIRKLGIDDENQIIEIIKATKFPNASFGMRLPPSEKIAWALMDKFGPEALLFIRLSIDDLGMLALQCLEEELFESKDIITNALARGIDIRWWRWRSFPDNPNYFPQNPDAIEFSSLSHQ